MKIEVDIEKGTISITDFDVVEDISGGRAKHVQSDIGGILETYDGSNKESIKNTIKNKYTRRSDDLELK